MTLANPLGIYTITLSVTDHKGTGIGQYERTVYPKGTDKHVVFFMGKVREVYPNPKGGWVGSVDLRPESTPKPKKAKRP